MTVATLAQAREAGRIDPAERVVAVITGEGLKTLDAVREGFEMTVIDPTVESFEAGRRGAAHAAA